MSSWLKTHLETFVEPYVGKVVPTTFDPFFTAAEMTVIKNCWRSVKASAKGRKVLLAGRDVFVFEVLARRENYPTLFLPECSRGTAPFIKLSEQDLFLFDTGFVGTIPRALDVSNFSLLSYNLNRMDDNRIQVFPRLTLSRHLALKIEQVPKYWQTARMVNGSVFQELSRKEEFEHAARVTIEVYRDSSSKFISHHKPMAERRDRWAFSL